MKVVWCLGNTLLFNLTIECLSRDTAELMVSNEHRRNDAYCEKRVSDSELMVNIYVHTNEIKVSEVYRKNAIQILYRIDRNKYNTYNIYKSDKYFTHPCSMYHTVAVAIGLYTRPTINREIT